MTAVIYSAIRAGTHVADISAGYPLIRCTLVQHVGLCVCVSALAASFPMLR